MAAPDPFAGLEFTEYTPAVQAARRAFVLSLASEAAEALADAAEADDPDEMVGHVLYALSKLGSAVPEMMRASLR